MTPGVRIRARIVAATAMSVVAGLAAPAFAQQGPSPAAAAFAEGESRYEAGEWMLAARAFHHAWELAENNPRRALILYNEARSLEQAAGHECDARARYEQFLRDADGSMPEAQERMGQARDRLAELDARVGAERCGDEASASEASPGGDGISPVGPIVMGAGAAMLIASAITGGLALATQSDLTAACGQDMHCPESSLGRIGDLRALALTTDVMLPVGAAVAIVGVVLTLLLHDGPAETPVTAWVGPNGAGAVVRGSM